MKGEETARYIIRKLGKKADDVLVSLTNGKKTQIKFVNNNIVTAKTWENQQSELFVSCKKRIITTVLRSFTRKAADDLIKHILAFAKNLQPNQDYHGIARGPFQYNEIKDCYDENIAGLSDDCIDLVESGINSALDQGAKRCAGVFEFADNSELLLGSNKVEAGQKGTGVYFSIRAFADKDASGYSNEVAASLGNFSPERAGTEAGRIAQLAAKPVKLKPGRYDILLEPYPFANLLDNFGNAASVFNVESGVSFLADKIGKQVAAECISICDDATIAGGLGSSKFDSEGVPSKKTLLVDKGIFKTYLHNTSTARKYKTETTANAGLIVPEPNNIVVSPGRVSAEHIFHDFSGLRITNVWYTRFQNYMTGDFSTIPRDGIFLYKNGRIINPVKSIRISDNILNILRNIADTTAEQKQSCGWEVETPVFCGSALIKNANITASTG
jgi:PmbA protein